MSALDTVFVCPTCGTAYPPSGEPPAHCPICEDVRQYLPEGGQRWATLVELASRHRNTVTRLEPHLFALRTHPTLGIGQRALLLQTEAGNVLWDCLTHLDHDTERAIRSLGGIDAIAISHPHYYSAHRAWAETFDATVLLHGDDGDWVMDRHPRVRPWRGERHPLPGGATLVRAGGHFPGGTVLHWPGGADGAGVLLSGDILQVTPDRSTMGFMYSYPNYLPLPAWEVEAVARSVADLAFDRVYGAFEGREIRAGGAEAVRRGARMTLAALRGELPGMRPRPGER